MALEIERKFLVKGEFMTDVQSASRIVQGYICSVPGRTVRIRISDQKAFLTIKGPSTDDGLSRYEFEQAIPVPDAEELLKLCEPGVIDKVRHYAKIENHIWEIDVFHGDNEGLIMAEIELSNPDEPFRKPLWLGEEVTGDRRYYNSMLTKYPYSAWDKK
ncbi:MAG: CYTH domain-containing protein [Tannerellaceae bacterium]|nr:CYTH domain-containing protein [Tannerellaceae bacterium]